MITIPPKLLKVDKQASEKLPYVRYDSSSIGRSMDAVACMRSLQTKTK